jgi:hypothetical protein
MKYALWLGTGLVWFATSRCHVCGLWFQAVTKVSTSLGRCKVSKERKMTFTLAAYVYKLVCVCFGGLTCSVYIIHWHVVSTRLVRAAQTAPNCQAPA